jgi:hypothetical protein
MSDAKEAFIASWLDAMEFQVRGMLEEYELQFGALPEPPAPTETRIVNLSFETCDFAIVPGSALFINQQMGEDQDDYRARYKKWFHANLKYPEFKSMVHSLKGKRIGHLNYPKPSIADVVKEYLDAH